MSRIDGVNVEPVVARSKAMNDRAPTSGQNETKVGLIIRNGNHGSYVGMGQDDFGIVKQASIGTTTMDQGMESNDGQEMDQEWNQVFEMMDRAELSDFVVKPSLKFNHALRGFGRSRSPPNLTIHSNLTGSVRSALCERSFKTATKSYYRQPENRELESWNHETEYKNKSRIETNGYESEIKKKRAQELGLGNSFVESAGHVDVNQNSETKSLMHKNNQRSHKVESNFTRGASRTETYNCPSYTLCNRPFKDNTQSFYQSNSFVKSKDNIYENQISEMETMSLMHENDQKNHNVESNFTRETSRSETCNFPSCSTGPRAFKYTTKSYSYSNSSEDESERIERKERE